MSLLFHDALASVHDVAERSHGRVVVEPSILCVANRVQILRQAPPVRELVGELTDQVLLDGTSLLVNGQALCGLIDSGVHNADLDVTEGEAGSVSCD